MSCSIHQRIPPSMWESTNPTHEAAQTLLDPRKARKVRSYGMLSLQGEDAVDALVERVGQQMATGDLNDDAARSLLAEGVHEISHTHDEVGDDEVLRAITAAVRERGL